MDHSEPQRRPLQRAAEVTVVPPPGRLSLNRDAAAALLALLLDAYAELTAQEHAHTADAA